MSDIQKKFVAMDRENIEAYTPKYGVDIILPIFQKIRWFEHLLVGIIITLLSI